MKATNQSPKLKAQTYTGRFLEAGVVQYEDEMAYIRQENLMNIGEKFKGAYVVIDHKDLTKDETDQVCGYISKVWLDDGWVWCDFVVNNEEAINLIDNENYSLSCAYWAITKDIKGTYHNIPYDKEIVDGEAIHLAIVNKPRYEDAIIYKNSIKDKIMTIFKFKKEEKKENSITKEIDLETARFEIEEGKTVSVADMIKAYNAAEEEKKAKEEEEKAKVNSDDEFEIDGKMVKVKDLANAYKAQMKKNEEEKEEEKKENEEDEKKDEEEKKEAKKNSKDFEEIEEAKKEALKNSKENQVKISTPMSELKLGKSLYGSK